MFCMLMRKHLSGGKILDISAAGRYLAVLYADRVVVFWDGQSRGTLSVIKYAEKAGKPCEVVLCQ